MRYHFRSQLGLWSKVVQVRVLAGQLNREQKGQFTLPFSIWGVSCQVLFQSIDRRMHGDDICLRVNHRRLDIRASERAADRVEIHSCTSSISVGDVSL